jgi:hypothetical protein
MRPDADGTLPAATLPPGAAVPLPLVQRPVIDGVASALYCDAARLEEAEPGLTRSDGPGRCGLEPRLTGLLLPSSERISWACDDARNPTAYQPRWSGMPRSEHAGMPRSEHVGMPRSGQAGSNGGSP